MRALSLVVILFAFWLLLSGNFVPFLLTMGAVSAVAVAMLGRRMDLIDHEGHGDAYVKGAPERVLEMCAASSAARISTLTPR